LKVARFDRATLCKVLRVKVKHHPFTFEVVEIYLLAFVGSEIETWRRRSHCRQLINCTGTIASQNGYDCERQEKNVLTHLMLPPHFLLELI
jgi:hypothetical protein